MHEKKLVDVYSGIFLLALSVVMFIATFFFRRLTASKIGSAFVPQLVAVGLFILSIVLIIQAYKAWKKEQVLVTKSTKEDDEALADSNVEVKDKPSYSMVIISLILMGIYLLIMPTVGFLISTSIYLFIQIYLIAPDDERKPIPFAIVSIATSVIIYFIFKNFFYLMLPAGLLG